MTFLCLLTILPGIRLLYDRQHVFLCFHTKFLSVIRHMSRIARCHTFLTMNFAMVLQCLYRIHSCSVDSYRVNKASLSVSIQQFDLVQIYTRLNLNIYVDGRQKKSILPYYFLFLSYGLNTEFEHRGMNTGVGHWRLKRVGTELCSDLCSKQKKKHLRNDS